MIDPDPETIRQQYRAADRALRLSFRAATAPSDEEAVYQLALAGLWPSHGCDPSTVVRAWSAGRADPDPLSVRSPGRMTRPRYSAGQ